MCGISKANNRIESLPSTTFAGKRINRKQLVEIQQTVKSCRHLSVREVGHTVCQHLNSTTATGKHSIQACLTALRQMEAVGLFQLPETKTRPDKVSQRPLSWSERSAPRATIEGSVGRFGEIRLELLAEEQPVSLFNEFIDRYHYLHYRRPIGSQLRYFIIGRDEPGERLLGCLLFAFAVNRLACRDGWIGWNHKQRDKHLPLLISNTRFLIFPWVKVKNLASKSLSLAAKRVPHAWLKQHGLQPVLIETFVNSERFPGTCYKAANWSLIGHSNGQKGNPNSKQKPESGVRVSAARRLPGDPDTKPNLAQTNRATTQKRDAGNRIAETHRTGPLG